MQNNAHPFWAGRRVFITGANGFLGSHLTQALLRRGNTPFVLLYEKNPGGIFEQEHLAARTTVIDGDVRNLPLLERILKENAIDTVFHLAAQAIVDQAIDDPLETYETNIAGTWNVLEAAKRYGNVKRIIIASSDKAYGDHADLPYQEDVHQLNGIHPYEVSKVCADLISQGQWQTFSLPLCITRCSNFYGPGDLKFNRIVPQTIKKLFHGEPPVIKDSGESLRDYLYIEDAVEGYLTLAEKMNETIFGHAFNFSTNRPLSVSDVIAAISSAMHIEIPPTIIRTKGFEIKHQYASYAKAKRHLGWEPRHTFVQGIKKTIPWYVAHFTRIANAT